MLTLKDIAIIIAFVVLLIIIKKMIDRNTLSTENYDKSENTEGGLATLTSTSKLLVTDDNGNLSTYTPTSEGFTTNELNVVNGTTTSLTSNSTGTTFSTPVNANAGINSSKGKFTSTLDVDGGITSSTGKFTSTLNVDGGVTSTTGKFTSTLNVDGGITTSTGKFTDFINAVAGISGTSSITFKDSTGTATLSAAQINFIKKAIPELYKILSLTIDYMLETNAIMKPAKLTNLIVGKMSFDINNENLTNLTTLFPA